MSQYVRFIFLVMILGSLVSLGIVVVANERSYREQEVKLKAERAALREAVQKMSDQLRRGQVAVNGQRVDKDGNVIETSLLVRQLTYRLEPLPVQEVVIPGSVMCVEGVRLEFEINFPEEYSEMRGANLSMLLNISGKDQKLGKSYTFWPGWADGTFVVPEAMQVHATGKEAHVTHLETKLWRNVWELLHMSKEEQVAGGMRVLRAAELPSLKTCSEVLLKDSRHSGFYEITVGLEGATITESFNSEERRKLIEAWEKSNRPERPVERAELPRR